MSKAITIRVSKPEIFSPFHDTTAGKEYAAELYGPGEVCGGHVIQEEEELGMLFIDDAGDECVAAYDRRVGVNFEVVA